MYVYLYDDFLRQRYFSKLVKAMEISLTDYGMTGKILRIHNYNDVRSLVEDEIKRGAKTVVIVGNDKTIGHVLSRCASLPCVFGFIPLGTENTIAAVLGIPIGIAACEIISKRRRALLDVGLVNSRFFISQLRVSPAHIQVKYDERFTVSGENFLEVVVCNLQPLIVSSVSSGQHDYIVHPQDGKLEAYVKPLTKRWWGGYKFEESSIFPFETMEITAHEPFTVYIDGNMFKEVRLLIKLADHKIDMIVGKYRKF
jgi:diacylglycerol kinase family enzyme